MRAPYDGMIEMQVTLKTYESKGDKDVSVQMLAYARV